MQRVIARYARPELGAVWTDEARMRAWRDVEVAAAEALEDGPSPDDLEAIRGATFTVEAVAEREAVTDHDVAAFVDVLSASAGPAGRWIHYGLTSSDVLDTALALQLRRAGGPIVAGARGLAVARAGRPRRAGLPRGARATQGAHAPPPHRGARGLGAVPVGPEGLERDAPQAQPDHDGAHHGPRTAAARLRPGGDGERRAVARARHLALGRRAGDPP